MFTAAMDDLAGPWFYYPALARTASSLLLPPEEARHAAAQRLRVGDAITLFDGAGCGASGRVVEIGARGRDVRIDILNRFTTPAPVTSLALYCALPKGERLATLLDMSTQLGMTQFTPLLCERSVVQPGPGWEARAQRICSEACKQSRRWHLPALASPATLGAALSSAREANARVWFAHPGGSVAPDPTTIREGVAIFVGPEGGFTQSEVDMADRAGAVRVTLGPRLLRIETAAIALLAIAGR